MKDYYERPEARRKRKRGCGLFIGLAAVTILLSLIVWGAMDQRRKQQEERREAEVRQVVEKFDALYREVAEATEDDHMRRLYERFGKGGEDNPDLKLTRLLFFSQDGMIRSSLDPREVGMKIGGRHHEAYLASNAEGAVFEVAESGEICIIRPVFNRKSCQVCHARRIRVLGVMDACQAPAPSP